MDIEIGIQIIKYLLTVVFGVILGNAEVFLFNRMPAEWFTDYGEEPSDELKDRYTQRIKSHPWKYILSMLFVAVGLYLVKDDWIYAVGAGLVIWLLVEMSAADIKYRIVPDQLVLLLGVSAIGFFQYHSWKEMLMGAAIGFGVMGVTALLGKLLYKRETIGGGDIKLFTALGLVTGTYGIITVFVLTALISGAHMVYLLASSRIKASDTIPMVPYIALSAGIYLVFLHSRIEEIILSL